MFIITVFLTAAFSYLKGTDTTVLLRNTVLCGMGAFTVLVLFLQAGESKTLDYDNGDNPGRFFISYFCCLLLALSCAYLPPAGWPFLAVFVVLSLFSNTTVGACSAACLLTLSMMLSGSGMEIFFLYFFCGMAGVIFFRGLGDPYRIGIPLLLAMLFLLTAETAGVVLYANGHLKLELFQVPLLNVLISLVLLLIILKIFSAMVIYRYRGKYMEINDPECALLVELKEKSKEEYFKAMHTAYFCDRIANKLSLDADAAKTGGYYHRIGLLKEENTWESVEKIAKEYVFPPVAESVLREYLDKETPVTRKETAVLIFSDAVVSAILFLFARKPGEKPDYDQVIETVFKQKLGTELLSECVISMEEINKMKTIFKEEKLYYDFLR